jgi:hypothetical protein
MKEQWVILISPGHHGSFVQIPGKFDSQKSAMDSYRNSYNNLTPSHCVLIIQCGDDKSG